jgi:hypothetical protein
LDGVAHVHVVIVGLARRDKGPKEKRLFSYGKLTADPVESRHGALSAYLFDATQVVNPSGFKQFSTIYGTQRSQFYLWRSRGLRSPQHNLPGQLISPSNNGRAAEPFEERL